MLITMMDRIARFLYGRYGSDQLNIALIIFSLVISIVMRFTPVWYLGYLCYIPLGFSVFRMLSRNIEARRKENLMFLKIVWPFKNWTQYTSRKVKIKPINIINVLNAKLFCVFQKDAAKFRLPAQNANMSLSRKLKGD